MKTIISTEQAPKAIGPYSQAVHVWVRVLGGVRLAPLDPATNQIIEGGIAAQTERVLENLKSVLRSCRFVTGSRSQNYGLPEGHG